MNSCHYSFFAIAFVLAVSLSSCTKTITETKIDTTTVTIRDTLTIRDTIGLTHVRFVSMFPPSVAPTINIIEPDTQTIWTVANFSCPDSWLLLPPDTSSTLFAQIPSNGWFKFIPLPKLGPQYVTVALFLSSTNTTDSDLITQWSNDSEKFKPAPPNMCYVRLINGITYASGPLFVDIDSVNDSLKNLNGQAIVTPNFTISDYALCPAGQHQLLLQADNPNDPKPEVLFTLSQRLKPGKYYTILTTGSSSVPVQPSITEE